MFKRFAVAAVLIGSFALLGASAAISSPPGSSSFPSGQRTYGQSSFDATTGFFVGGGGAVESAYDDMTGTLIYLQTPNGAKVHPAKAIDPATGLPVNVAPIYIPVYPAGSGIDPSMLNCAHVPVDNCPDHGPAVAGAAMGIMPGVYGGGVLGHDHLAGIASTGGDFNIVWEPVLVLFTNSAAATEHITTLAQINSDLASGDVIEVPLPQLDFNCAPVSAARYWKAAPVTSG